MVVADDSVWNGYAGKALQAILDKPLKACHKTSLNFTRAMWKKNTMTE